MMACMLNRPFPSMLVAPRTIWGWQQHCLSSVNCLTSRPPLQQSNTHGFVALCFSCGWHVPLALAQHDYVALKSLAQAEGGSDTASALQVASFATAEGRQGLDQSAGL